MDGNVLYFALLVAVWLVCIPLGLKMRRQNLRDELELERLRDKR